MFRQRETYWQDRREGRNREREREETRKEKVNLNVAGKRLRKRRDSRD
jgi:hypothetical protein